MRYLAGLSFGPSSSVMTQMLDDNARYYLIKKSSVSAFEPRMVHVDTDLSRSAQAAEAAGTDSPAQRLLARHRETFPHASFECVHLSRVLAVKTVDWAALPPLGEGDDSERLRRFFDGLPSLTAKSDILRLLIRHLLLHLAMEGSYRALLLGHSTTALAALTLAEVANGRGFSVPSQVSDGPLAVSTYEQSTDPDSGESTSREVSKTDCQVYYPVREVFKNEIMTYVSFTPSVADLVPADQKTSAGGSGSVVSHKDLSIDEVMARYFEGVEGPHAGIVANVVRTAGKLERVGGRRSCRLCGMALDELGDSRWAGEMGEKDQGDASGGSHSSTMLCYGCKRSIHG